MTMTPCLRSLVRSLSCAAILIAAIPSSALTAQQSCANSIDPSGWASSYIGGLYTRTAVLFVNLLSVPLEPCFVQLYHEDDTPLASADERVVIRRESVTGPVVARSSWARIPATPGLVTMPVPNSARLLPGVRYFIVSEHRTGAIFSNPVVTPPYGRSGPVSQVWTYSGYTGWRQTQDRSYLYNVGYRLAGNARFQTIGAGCGTVEPCNSTVYRSINWNGPPLRRVATGGLQAFRVSDPGGQLGTRDICAIDLRLGTTEQDPGLLRLRIFDDRGNAPNSELVDTSVTVMPGNPQVYNIQLPSPVHIRGSGTEYWVVMDVTFPLVLPISQFGTPELSATNDGTGWVTSNSDSWSIRTYETAMPRELVPVLTSTAPRLGTTARTSLNGSGPQRSAAMFFGENSSNLPLDLLGAVGCRLYVEPLATIPLTTDTQGRASRNIAIPNDLSWFGVSYFVQFAVIEPGVNALGVAFSNGGEGIVGN